MDRRRSPAALAALACALAGSAACIDPLGEEHSAIGEVTADCVVPMPAGIAGWGAPASLEYPDHSLWLWDQVDLAGGGAVAGAAAVATDAAGTCASGPTFVADGAGVPRSVLALTAAEVAANQARTDGKRLALVPRGGFVHDGDGYLLYAHALHGPGIWDYQELGTGLCVLAAGATSCERVAVAGDTMLWPPEHWLGGGGLVVGDRALVLGCRKVAAFLDPCVITGAPLDRLRDPSAYQVWNVFSGWTDDARNGSVLVDSAGPVTLSAYDGGFLATSLDIFEGRVGARRSSRADQDYGHAADLFDVVPASFFPAGGREHSGLRHGEPRTIHVSYGTDGDTAPGLHLVTFRFFGDLE